MAAITLNGVSFTPSNIEPAHEKIGTTIQAANGARRWAHRADKRVWTITWDKVALATLTAIRAVFALTSTFTYVDENGVSATVFCQAGALKSSVSEMGMSAGTQVLYYDVTLEITEA